MTDIKGVATLVRHLNGNAHSKGRVYRVEPPHVDYDGDNPTEYVWVSAATLPMGLGTETYIFACDEAGEVTSWGEMPGSIKNSLDHDEALRDAGYEVSA